jgi:hypothetical protein
MKNNMWAIPLAVGALALISVSALGTATCQASIGGGSMEEVQQWLHTKLDDPKSGPRFKELTDEVEKACGASDAATKGDPMACWHSQERALAEMSKVASSDRVTPAVPAAFRKDLRSVRRAESEWLHFSTKARAAKRRVIADLIEAVTSANGDVKAGLEALKSKPGVRKAVVVAADRALTIFGGRCIWGCICGTAEGCPCCGYDAIFRSVLL